VISEKITDVSVCMRQGFHRVCMGLAVWVLLPMGSS
jgi:hypothetical protein